MDAVSDTELCRCVSSVGRDFLRDEAGSGVIPAADFGGDAALYGGIDVVSDFALAQRSAADDGAVENGGDFRGAAALRGKRRRLLGGTDGSIGGRGAAGGYGDVVDGDCGLAKAGRAQAVGADSVWDCAGICRNGGSGGAGAAGAFRSRRSGGGGSVDCGVAGVGLRIVVFEAWRVAKFAAVGSGDARSVRRRSNVDCGAADRRVGEVSPDGRAGACVAGGWIPVCVWLVYRVPGVSLHFEEEHSGAGRDVRVRESDGGAGDWLAGGRGRVVAKDAGGRGGDSDSGGAGDYRAASRSARGRGCIAGAGRSVEISTN